MWLCAGSYRSRGSPCASAGWAAPPATRKYRTPTHITHLLSSETFALDRLPDLLVETDKSNDLSHHFVLDGLQCYVISDVCKTAQPTRSKKTIRARLLGGTTWRNARRSPCAIGEARFLGFTPLSWLPLELMCITPPLFTPSQSQHGHADLAQPCQRTQGPYKIS